jgi:hypothetical protein
MGVLTLGFEEGSKVIKDSSFQKYKGEKGKEDIVGFAWDVSSELFRAANGHYSKAAEKGWLCLSTETEKAICCTADYDGNEPKMKVGTVLVIYRVEEGLIKGIKGVLPWIISPKVFQQLLAIYRVHGNVDFVANCTDSKFQNFTFVPMKESAWQKTEQSKQSVKTKAAAIFKTLEKMLYTKVSASEIREHLGISMGSSDASSGLSLDGIAGTL